MVAQSTSSDVHDADADLEDGPGPEAVVPKEAAPAVKLPQLIDAVIEMSGQKRNVVKPVVEAMLVVLSQKITVGSDLILPPLGRLKVVKRSEDTGVVTLKLRAAGQEGKSAKKDKQTLAAQED